MTPSPRLPRAGFAHLIITTACFFQCFAGFLDQKDEEYHTKDERCKMNGGGREMAPFFLVKQKLSNGLSWSVKGSSAMRRECFLPAPYNEVGLPALVVNINAITRL